MQLPHLALLHVENSGSLKRFTNAAEKQWPTDVAQLCQSETDFVNLPNLNVLESILSYFVNAMFGWGKMGHKEPQKF